MRKSLFNILSIHILKLKISGCDIDDLRARSTCEQDRSVCAILHILSWRYGRIVTFWCIYVLVILHLKRHACMIISVQYNFLYDLPTHLQAWRRTSQRGLANSCLFLCNLCMCVFVIFHLKRHACVIITVQYNILYDLPTHLQAWRRTSQRGLTNPCLFWCNQCVISHILPITKATRVR
jgi:hypothetical protein